MTVATETFWNVSTGNGVTAVFGFTFPVTQKADVVVLLDGVVAAGNYSVTFTDPDNPLGGGSVTFEPTFEPASGVEVLRIRRLEYLQALTLSSQSPFNAQVVERAFDRVVMLTQQVAKRALLVPDTVLADGFDGQVSGTPSPGSAPIVNASGTGWAFSTPESSGVFAEICVNDYLSGSNWGAAFNDAIATLPSAGGIIRLRPGSDVSLADAQVACAGNNVVFDFRGSKIRPRYTSGAAFKFGTGAAQVQQYTVLGGWFLYDSAASGGPTQALFELRGVRGFRTVNCAGNNLYQLAVWGNPADAQSSYKWWLLANEWNMRANANGGHSDCIQADGSLGGIYMYGSDVEGDSLNVSGTQAFLRLTSAQGPARFDHAEFGTGIVKGFDHAIRAVDARIVNVEQGAGFRFDDMQSYGVRVDVSSGASKGGCEDVHLRGSFAGLGPGGAVYVSNASASIACSDILVEGATSNNCTGPVCKFETTGSGTIRNVHVTALHVGDYNPSDANQDAVIFDGDIDEFSCDVVHVDGKAGATYLARRVIYDNTAGTKRNYIGPNIDGNVNTALVTRTNAGHLTGRYNLVPRSAAVNYESVRVLQVGGGISMTGSTAASTLATISIPAGAMGANGQIEIDSFWSGTNSGNNKTMRHVFGGTNYLAQNFTTQLAWHALTTIWNTGATGTQKGSNNNTYGALSAALNTSSVDTTGAVTVALTGQLADSSETLTLERYSVKLLYAA